MRRVRTEDDLIELRQGAQGFAIVVAWARLGLFERGRELGMFALDELGIEARAASISAKILMHMGLLEGDGETYSLTSVCRRMLDAGELAVGPTAALLDDLSRLDEVLRSGGPARARDGSSRGTSGGVREDKPEEARAFLMHLYRRSEASAKAAARWIRPRLGDRAHVLDLGGGHGRYAYEFVQAGLVATVFDRALCTSVAREIHGDALGYIAGDFTKDPLGGPYDAVFLSNVVHGNSDAENVALLRRLREIVVPGGLVAVKDMFIDDQGRDPSNAAMFGLTMLLYTEGGQSYTGREVERQFARSGWQRPEMVAVDDFVVAFSRRLD